MGPEFFGSGFVCELDKDEEQKYIWNGELEYLVPYATISTEESTSPGLVFLEQDFNLNSTFESHKKPWKFLEGRFQFISYRSLSKYFRIYFTVISGPGHR